jgi:hypothetical protein
LNSTQNFFSNQLPALLKAKPALAGSLHRAIQFSVQGDGGGDWALDATKPDVNVMAGRVAKSAVELRCSATTFNALVERQLTVRQAFDSALLTIQGDVGVAMKLGVLFVPASTKAEVKS